jgi:hypothetical protein
MRCHPVVALAAFAALLSATAANAAPVVQFAAGSTGAVEFNLPGGRVGCTFIKAGGTSVYKTRDGGAELSCDRTSPKYSRVQIGSKGAAAVLTNVGDPSCCGASNILQIGQVWRGGPFTCKSEVSGLSCARDDGRGFTLTKRGIAVR